MSLEIAPAADAGHLPVCTPFLMPFHISYNGSAPVSRYLHPRPAPPSLAALSVQSSSTATMVASSSSTSMLSETTSSLALYSSTTSVGTLARETESGAHALFSNTGSSIDVINQVDQMTTARLVVDADMGTDSETQPALGAVPLNSASRWSREHTSAPGNRRRFIAAFRGRQIYGQAMDIPNGYGGLVLRAPFDPQGRKEEVAAPLKPLSRQAKPKSKTRVTTRRFRKRVNVDVSADELEEGHNDDCYPDPDVDPLPVTRKLVPYSTFTSFMLWTPDRPLDEGKDEYVRALVEWTHLAAEIHSYDDAERG